MHPSAFAKMEAGSRALRVNEAAAVTAALGMTLSQMLMGTDKNTLEAELELVEAAFEQASDESDEALRRAAALRNRARELLVAITDLAD